MLLRSLHGIFDLALVPVAHDSWVALAAMPYSRVIRAKPSRHANLKAERLAKVGNGFEAQHDG
jgi:hypothetical protein